MLIVSWNILQGGGVRAKEIAEKLVEWKPDVVCLSEYRRGKNSELISKRLSSVGLNQHLMAKALGKPSTNRVFIASRFPFEEIALPEVCHGTGCWLAVRLQCKSPLTIAALHIPNRTELGGIKYEFQAKVVEFMKAHVDDDAIVIGDTNSGRQGEDEEGSYFNKREHKWFDAIGEAGWFDSWRKRNPEGREYSWRTHAGAGFRLDQAFTSPSADKRVRSVGYLVRPLSPVTGKQLSDHTPLQVKLEEVLKPATTI